jgi:peptidylprolyl isomerase
MSRTRRTQVRARLTFRSQYFLNNKRFVLLLSLVTIPVFSQTTAQPKLQIPVHHTVTSSAKPAGPQLPPGIPPVQAPLKTEFALRYQDIVVGTGPEAQPGQLYKVHYTGWLESDGTKFDSSVDRGEPFEFLQGMHQVIPGWDQGFEGMNVGGKRRLFIPYELAYGASGRGPIPPKANLIFDVELLDVRDLHAPTGPSGIVPQIPPQPAPPPQPRSAPQPNSPPQSPIPPQPR